ncbi:MAG TPA: PD-(D/E)XK nuclease family protein [Actinomycetes bacterium]|nr:PD-(D/E)XK nuclease family protein [Actinomycetes bacterium]
MTDLDLFDGIDLFPTVDDGPIDVLSGSSLNTFLRCARQWEYAYVYRFKRPPALRMVTGTAGHRAIEVHMVGKLETAQDAPLDVVLDAFSDSFDIEAQDAEDTKNEKGDWKDKGARGVKLWHKEVAPTIDPEYVEQPISFVINDIPWTGTLDLATKGRTVIDHKFTSKSPSSADAYVLNMVGYAIGYRKLTGEIESGVELDHVVMTKEPKMVPIKSAGPVSDASIIAFADIAETAMRSIKAGIFPANGLKSGACSWCGYRDICPAYKESPMARNTG